MLSARMSITSQPGCPSKSFHYSEKGCGSSRGLETGCPVDVLSAGHVLIELKVIVGMSLKWTE